MDDIKNHTASIPFNSTVCLSSSEDVPRQAMEEVEQQLRVLGVNKWRDITLMNLNIHLRPHQELTLKAYLYWLHQNLVRWKLTEYSIPRHQSALIQWCCRLRSHGFEFQTTYKAFKNWMSVQAKIDPTSEAKYKALDEVIIGPFIERENDNSTKRIADPVRQKATQKTSIMEKQLTIEVSSGEDSDMEFLGDGTSSHGIEDCDSSDKEMGIIATKGNMTQLEPGRTVQLEPIIPEIQGRKATNLKNGTWEYICKRCHKPGHHLTDCPTNFDPSYDTKPTDQYTCAICGAVEEHYGTLCPKNTAPWSLNQLRLKSGVRSRDRQQGGDGIYHISDDASTKMRVITRKRSRETAADYSRSNSHRFPEVENEIDHIHESRRALVEYARSRQQSPEDGRMIDHHRENRHGSPLPKRLKNQRERVDAEREHAGDGIYGHHHREDRKMRRRHDQRGRSASPEEVRGGYANRARSPELLSVVRHDDHTSGRLSYWDDEYSSPRHMNKRHDASEPWSAPRRDKNIEWEHEMATFDADKFLESMHDHLVAYKLAQSRRSMMAPPSLRGADSQTASNNNTAQTHGCCTQSPNRRNSSPSIQTTREFNGSFDLWPKRGSDSSRATSDEAEGVSSAVRAAVQAARVVPVYTVERKE